MVAANGDDVLPCCDSLGTARSETHRSCSSVQVSKLQPASAGSSVSCSSALTSPVGDIHGGCRHMLTGQQVWRLAYGSASSNPIVSDSVVVGGHVSMTSQNPGSAVCVCFCCEAQTTIVRITSPR